MGRILGLDYGRKRIGVAITDPLGLIAQPFETWQGLSRRAALDQVKKLVEGFEIEKVVLGLPLALSGNKGRMALEVETFAGLLRETVDVPVVLWDERFSSVASHKAMHAMDLKPSRDKALVDRIAASLQLQAYLEYVHASTASPTPEDQ